MIYIEAWGPLYLVSEPGKKPWMVFEYMPHGDLADVLRGNSGHFHVNNPDIPRLSKVSEIILLFFVGFFGIFKYTTLILYHDVDVTLPSLDIQPATR